MQSYYEIETEIPADHELKLRLPDNIPSGHAKITIAYELSPTSGNKATKFTAFLATLPDIPDGKGLSQAAINDYIEKERQSWD